MRVPWGDMQVPTRLMPELREFYWNGMRKDVRTYIRECDVCQCNKSENLKPIGLLQPLPIPKEAWV